MPRIPAAPGTSNREFLEAHAGPGRVGLACGAYWLDTIIRRAQRVETKRNTAEDIFRSPVPHTTWLLERKTDGAKGGR